MGYCLCFSFQVKKVCDHTCEEQQNKRSQRNFAGLPARTALKFAPVLQASLSTSVAKPIYGGAAASLTGLSTAMRAPISTGVQRRMKEAVRNELIGGANDFQ